MKILDFESNVNWHVVKVNQGTTREIKMLREGTTSHLKREQHYEREFPTCTCTFLSIHAPFCFTRTTATTMNPNEQQPPLCTPKRSDTLYHLSSTKSNKSSQSCHSSISSFNSTGTTVHYKNYATHNIKAVPARGVRHENGRKFSISSPCSLSQYA